MTNANGTDAGGNNIADDFLARYNAIVAQKTIVADANADLRKLFREAEKAGHNARAMKRALRDAEISGSQRQADDRSYREMMAWLKKPVDIGPDPAGASQPSDIMMTETDRLESDRGGYAVGKMGGRRDANPWVPGSLHFQAWDGGWMRGADEREKAASGPTPPPARGPGRPRRPTNGAGAGATP